MLARASAAEAELVARQSWWRKLIAKDEVAAAQGSAARSGDQAEAQLTQMQAELQTALVAEQESAAAQQQLSEQTMFQSLNLEPETSSITYVCKARAVIRSGCEMSTEQIGVLEVGTVVTALEEARDSKGTARVRLERGWTSKTTADGRMVLEETLLSTDCSAAAAVAPSSSNSVDTKDQHVQEGVPPA